MILRADHPTYKDLIVPGTPLRNPDTTALPQTRAPKLGEHADEVLGGLLGVSRPRMAELRTRNVI